MKRLILLFALTLFSLTLVACKDNEAGDVTATIDQVDVELTSFSFKATITDPNNEITGAITVVLLDSTGTVKHTKDIQDRVELDNYAIGGLVNTMTYKLRINATIGRNLVTLVERTIELASAELVHITTAEEFLQMSNNRAGNYVLDNDIDFTGVTFNSPFTSAFSGTFDGAGFALKNITFEKVVAYTGVFGYVSGAVIKDVTFDNITIGTEEAPLTMTTSSRVGIVAGYVASSTGKLENIIVKNSTINFSSSSTVQAYVGGLVGEFKGNVTGATLEETTITVKSTSYGRIRVGGAIGLLGEEGIVKQVNSGADINFDMVGANIKDRNLNINIGGVIGYHNGRNVNRSVEEIMSTGDITLDLDFGTSEGTTNANYSIYVGGIAGIAYSNVNQALYAGSITLNHEKNLNEEDVNKYVFIGGLYGFYGSDKKSEANLRYSDMASIDLTVSDDVNVYASGLVADMDSDALNVFNYYGDLGLMVNAVDQSGTDVIEVITSLDGFFTSEMINAWLAN
jgi:hypothetical protein